MRGLFLGSMLALCIAPAACAHQPYGGYYTGQSNGTRGSNPCYLADKTWYHERWDGVCDRGGTHDPQRPGVPAASWEYGSYTLAPLAPAVTIVQPPTVVYSAPVIQNRGYYDYRQRMCWNRFGTFPC